jgi:single-strand DNA-binding protein
MATNINRVVLEGELLDDPRELQDRCRLRLLVLGLRKIEPQDGETEPTWEGKRNEFDVLVWGALAARCVAELEAGMPVAVEGRLEWIRGTQGVDGPIHARVEVVADDVRFLAERATPAAAAA